MIKKTFNFAKKVKMSIHNKIVETAITFDDVLLSLLTQKFYPIKFLLNLEFQTKSRLMFLSFRSDGHGYRSRFGIAIARVGGLGFIHKNMPIPEQAAQVNRVKRSENGMIADPVTLSKDHTLAEAKELMAKYKISGLQ